LKTVLSEGKSGWEKWNSVSASFLWVISIVEYNSCLCHSSVEMGNNCHCGETTRKITEKVNKGPLNVSLLANSRISFAAFASGAFANQKSRPRVINITSTVLKSCFYKARAEKQLRLHPLFLTYININLICSIQSFKHSSLN